MPYAHAVIDASDGTRYQRGDEVDLDKFTQEELGDLQDGGAIREEDYDEAADKVGPPDTIVIEGVEYVKAVDAAEEDSHGTV
jgi:hypothetical protein